MKRRQSVEGMPVGAETKDDEEMVANDDEAIDMRTASTTAARRKAPTLPYLIALNSLICGIEFSASAGYAYIPPLLQKCGLSKSVTTCLMGIGPYMALGVIPLLGRWSDRCQFRYGRRWLFILGISLLVLTSLMFMLIGASLSISTSTKTLGVVTTAIGVILLDLSCLIGFNPCEALVSEAVQGTDNTKQGFMVYSCMLSLGGCVGYLITATDWSDTLLGRMFAIQEQMAFSVVMVLMLLATITTLIAAAKKPTNAETTVNRHPTYAKVSKIGVDALDDCGYETGSNDSLGDETCRNASKTYTLLNHKHSPPYGGGGGNNTSAVFLCYRVLQKIVATVQWTARHLRTVVLMVLAVPVRLASLPIRTVKHVFVVPLVLRRLFFADLWGWASLLCYYMFYTDYVAQSVYGGDPNAAEHSRGRTLYDAGVRMGSFGLLLHSITSCFYSAFLQDVIISRYGMASAYLFGLSTFGVCMLGILVSSDINVINFITAMAGLGFTAITTIPNTLITGYQADKELYFFDAKKSDDDDVAPEHGTGEDFAVIDSAYILAQIMISVVMGPLADLTQSVSVYIVNSMLFASLACYCASRVVFTANSARHLHESKA